MKKLTLIICSLVLLQQLVAQQPDLVFHHLTQKDGLSYNIVNCFLKDSRGMLWIGTYNGLNRYDGAHFSVIQKGKDKNSLPNNTVHKLAEDKKGNIWGATDNGIFCYNQQQKSFKNYQAPGEKRWPIILNIICDKQGAVWACSRNSLIKFNAAADSFETAPLAITDKKIGEGFVCRKNGLVESPDGKGLWLASRQGLLYYDKTAQQFTSSYTNFDTVLFAPKSASALCATNFGHYWYIDNEKKKLIGFDPVAKKVKFSIQSKEFLSGYEVATVFEDNNHLLWICTWGYELFTIDYLNGNKINRVTHQKENSLSIAGDFFWDVMQENDGTIWLGTVGGISRCNTNQLFYKVHSFNQDKFTQNGAAINFLSEDKNDVTWWVGTTKGILLQYNPVTSKSISFNLNAFPANKKGLKPEKINQLLRLNKKTFLFTNNGIWVKESNTAFSVFKLPTIADTVVVREAAMLNDTIVFCTDYKRLWQWNIKTSKVTEFFYEQPFAINGSAAPVFVNLTPVNGNKIWTLNGYNWLSHTNENSLVPVQYASAADDAGTGYYTRMIADKASSLWIAKKAVGLIKYNPFTNKTIQYNQYDGLVMDHIMAITADNSGKIWTAAYNQFSVFNPKLNSFYNFTLPLSANNYAYINQMATLANGNIICNIANEVVEFFPGRLKTFAVTAQPLISTITVAGSEELLPESNSISLTASDNSVLIKFGLLTDYAATPYDMLYNMGGLDKNWINSGSSFEASYNNLPPGNYTFKVKAIAKDKSWQTKETTLQIYIATPFYKSWWFIFLLASITVAALYFLYRYRLRRQQEVMQLESKAQLLEKEKTIVMYESLKQQLNPHFLFNSLTSLSGLIESDQQKANQFLEQMSGIYRYILKSGDNEIVLLKDEMKFVQQYITLQQTRFKKGLQININVPDDYLHYKIAPVTLQNLIENAIKHNIIDIESPLVITIFIEGDYLVVQNNLQKKNVVETSNKKGLVQFAALYKYLSTKPVLIDETTTDFTIKIPLI